MPEREREREREREKLKTEGDTKWERIKQGNNRAQTDREREGEKERFKNVQMNRNIKRELYRKRNLEELCSFKLTQVPDMRPVVLYSFFVFVWGGGGEWRLIRKEKNLSKGNMNQDNQS